MQTYRCSLRFHLEKIRRRFYIKYYSVHNKILFFLNKINSNIHYILFDNYIHHIGLFFLYLHFKSFKWFLSGSEQMVSPLLKF